jgi:hypothetical protein
MPGTALRSLTALFLPAVLPLVLMTGCSGTPEGRVAVYPVRGKVLYRGKPLADALVVFQPTTPAKPGVDVPQPTGRTDAEGLFRLHTYEGSDGASAGDYLVGVSGVTAPITEKGLFSADKAAPRPDPLQGRFADPRTSGLKAHVNEAETEIPPIDLK